MNTIQAKPGLEQTGSYLKALRAGSTARSLAGLRIEMRSFGLTSADLETTDEELVELRRQYGIRCAAPMLEGLRAGSQSVLHSPATLQHTMCEYGLAPADLKTTVKELMGLRHLYGIRRAAPMLEGLRTGSTSDVYTPAELKATMRDYGLAPADLKTTDEELTELAHQYGIRRGKIVLERLRSGDPPLVNPPPELEITMHNYRVCPADIGMTDDEVVAYRLG